MEGGADEVLRHRNCEEHSTGLEDAERFIHIAHSILLALLIVFGVYGI